MLPKLKLLTFLLLSTTFISCKRNNPDALAGVLSKAGSNSVELEKVINYYKQSGDSLKLEAAYFLIKNMDEHYYYDASFFNEYNYIFSFADSIDRYKIRGNHIIDAHDSLARMFAPNRNNLRKEYDIHMVSADMLIENIEVAFRAWQKPWARHLDFEQFCEYILPYKAVNEKPTLWRRKLWEQYNWLGDSLQNKQSAQEACTWINKNLQSWFHIDARFGYPGPVSVENLFKGRIGRCTDAANLALYTMRAVGIPVVIDFTPQWANRSLGHAWNAVLYTNGRMVNFMGAESHPGLSKTEYVNYNVVRQKRAKIYRRTYAKQPNSLAMLRDSTDEVPRLFMDCHFRDVTAEYMPVSNVEVSVHEPDSEQKNAYLCVFDNAQWQPVHWGKIKNNTVSFSDMGRDIVYLPTFYYDNALFPAAAPFLLANTGQVTPLIADESRLQTVKLLRKYPDDDSNTIKSGEHYELFYWRGGWVSLGEQKAQQEQLIYKNIPSDALYWLRNLDRGSQERIFTIQNGKQIWW